MLEVWYQALDCEIGLAVSVETIDGRINKSDRRWLQRELYAARTASLAVVLQSLSLVLPVKEDEIWIMRSNYAETSRAGFTEGHDQPISE